MDPFFRVEVIEKTLNPQQAIYAGLHQDYSEGFVYDSRDRWPSESECGAIAVRQLLKGGRGHFGPLEHPQIIFNCGWFPHSAMQQLRTHRTGISFDVQSGRYSGDRIVQAANGALSIEEVFYLRPVGSYCDRQGKKYDYSEPNRNDDLRWCEMSAQKYKSKIEHGHSEEHARGIIPFDVRQHWIVSMNLRSLFHILLIRGKPDAQLEIQQMCELMLPHFKDWCPEIYEWFYETLWMKGRLAP